MSKLGDRIRKASRLAPQAIGFGANRADAGATILLLGFSKDGRDAADLLRRGADAVVVGGPGKPARPQDAGQAGEALTGAWIEGERDAKEYREAGFDFVVFNPDTTASTSVLDDTVGYVLVLPEDLTDLEIRTLESFQLDAIDVGAIDSALTVRRQIDLRRIFAMTRKPLLASVRGDISVAELQALRDTNVAVVASDNAGDIERLRKTIDALPPRTRRKDDERPTPLVPRSAPGAEEHEHEDDD